MIAKMLLSAVLMVPFAAAPLLAQGADPNDIDRSVKPGNDFYRYANGGWLRTATIPAGQRSFDTRAILRERTSHRVRDLIQEAASSHAVKGSIGQKLGDYYASFIDQSAIEAKGLAPLADDLAKIAAIESKRSLSAYLGSTLNTEIDGLIGNADHVFGLFVNQGFEDSKHNYPHLLQGGLGLADRESYLDASPKATESRAHYQAHIASLLKLAGVADSDAAAAHVLALEIQMARAHAPDSDAADVFKQNNPWKRSDFTAKAPGMDWEAYFEAAGLAAQPDFIVWQPTAITGTAALVGSEDLATWKDYLRFHLLEHYASVLPKSVGGDEGADREKAAIAATTGALGQAIGQLYTQRYFPAHAKAKAQAMVRDLITAYRIRIANLSWMAPQTK